MRACTVAPVNSPQQFRVIDLAAVGYLADVAVAITSPSGGRVKSTIAPIRDGSLPGYWIEYTPSELGDHLVDILYGGELLLNRGGIPYRVRCVLPPAAAAEIVRAYGPGLSGGMAGRAAEFVIDTRGAGPGGLGVTVEGPSEAAIQCRDNGDGTCSVAYLPSTSGDYHVNISFNNQPISGSPFVARVIDNPVSKVRTYGSGIQRDNGTGCEDAFTECILSFLLHHNLNTPERIQRERKIPLFIAPLLNHYVRFSSICCDEFSFCFSLDISNLMQL